jgi:acyl-CoA synthetase (AMP-forming)/AMP-acid ligase II
MTGSMLTRVNTMIKNTIQYIGVLFGASLAGAIPFYIMYVMGVLK